MHRNLFKLLSLIRDNTIQLPGVDMDYMHADQFADLLRSQRLFDTDIGLRIYDLGIADSLYSYEEAIKGLAGASDWDFAELALQRLGELMVEARNIPELFSGRIEDRSRGVSALERTGPLFRMNFTAWESRHS